MHFIIQSLINPFMQQQCPQKLQIYCSDVQGQDNDMKNEKNISQKGDQAEIFQVNIIKNVKQVIGGVNYQHQKFSQVSTEKLQGENKKSVFHNFQKHLVITLRKCVKIRKLNSKNDQKAVASQIWQIFLSQSKVYTKNILHILFGVVDYEGSDLTNIYDEEIIEKFGYEQIFSKYTEQILLKAQGYLRHEVIRQIKKINMQQVLKKRRLTNTEKFAEYVKEFVGELQEGPMRKRLPKNKKAQMKLQTFSKNQ